MEISACRCPRLRSFHPIRRSRNSSRRPARSMRIATCSGRRRNFPSRRSANTRLATRRRKSCSRCATFSASTRTSSCRRRATPRTTARRSMRSEPPTAGRAGSHSSARKSPTASSQGDGQGRRARRALQFRQAARRIHAARRAGAHRRRAWRSSAGTSSSISRCRTSRRWKAFFTALPTTVVVDHMGAPDVRKGVDHPENRRFHALMERHKNFWVKVTCPERLTRRRAALRRRGAVRPRSGRALSRSRDLGHRLAASRT